MKQQLATRITNFLVGYFTLKPQLVPQAEAETDIRDGVSFRGTNTIILVIAIFIASIGLNTNSSAVIIGAMLISPLMGPIIGVGLGVGIHDYQLISRSLRNLVMAAGFSVLASTIYFLISPVNEGHSELLARTSPTIYDVLVGFFGGGAGIIAMGSKSKGNVIPGVAIATALMPPLCTVGYGIATWQVNYVFGAFYLFLINSIYIAFATFIGVKLLGYKGEDIVDNARAQRVRRIVYIVTVLTMLPSVYLTYRMLLDNKFTMEANRFVAQECRFPETQVLHRSAEVIDGQKTITITLIGRVLPIDSLQLALSPRLAAFGLEGAKLRFVQGGQQRSDEITTTAGLRDIYELAQTKIATQQSAIDSLRMIAAETKAANDAGARIAPELKVVFPQVSNIAIVSGVFASVDTEHSDTLNIALVTYRHPMPEATLEKFRQYLCVRLGLKNIDIVPTTLPQSHHKLNGTNDN